MCLHILIKSLFQLDEEDQKATKGCLKQEESFSSLQTKEGIVEKGGACNLGVKIENMRVRLRERERN